MKYIKKVLPNGMTVILAPMKSTDGIVSVGFFVRAGAANDTADTSGMAHFLEHMTFMGTKNRPSDQVVRQLDMLGVEYNAATSMETTHYYMHGNSADVKKILDIALDLYINPVFDPKAINKEKKVIIEEMRMRSDAPYMQLYSALLSKMFKSTPFSRNIVGTEDSVMSFTRKDFVEFRNVMYRPDSTVFVVTGNFIPEMVYKSIAKPLGQLENPILNLEEVDTDSKSMRQIIYSNMETQSNPFIHLKKTADTKQVYLLMGFPMFNLYETYGKEIDLMAHTLTSGLSSRLFNALRVKKGITYSSIAYPYVYSEGGIFVIKSTLHPDGLVPGLKIILRELRKLKTNPIESEELHKVKKIAVNNTLFSLTRPTDYLMYYGMSFLDNPNAKPNVKADVESIKHVRAASIQKVAEKIFLKSKINLYLYGNVDRTDFTFMKL